MPIDYKKYPPNWITEIRPAILQRAKNRCEFCGVKNYSVGNWNGKRFIPICGDFYPDYYPGNSQKLDAMGDGELSYKEARHFVRFYNRRKEVYDDTLIVIVLTIAHLDHDVHNNDYSNLKALCQRCHNRYDVRFRISNRYRNANILQYTIF